MGLFITFEGPEGCGKSTHSKLLEKFLKKKDFKVKTTREPGGTKIGKQIRNVLLAINNKELSPLAEFFLLLADRNQNVTENILPFLKENYIVISDRFIDSSVAYQHGGRNIKIDIIDKLNNIATYKIKPDITFLLINENIEGALENAKQKSGTVDRFENENLKFHKKIYNIYKKLAKKEKRIHLINIKGDINTTQKLIREIVLKKIKLSGLQNDKY